MRNALENAGTKIKQFVLSISPYDFGKKVYTAKNSNPAFDIITVKMKNGGEVSIDSGFIVSYSSDSPMNHLKMAKDFHTVAGVLANMCGQNLPPLPQIRVKNSYPWWRVQRLAAKLKSGFATPAAG